MVGKGRPQDVALGGGGDKEEEAKAPFLIYFCTYINVALLLVDLKRFTVRQ